MKRALIASACAAALGLSACNGTLSPQAQQDITVVYTAMCAALPAAGPTIAKLNAQIQADYAQAQTICAAGSPTNAVAAGIDILALYTALQQYLPNIHVRAEAPDVKAALTRLNIRLP